MPQNPFGDRFDFEVGPEIVFPVEAGDERGFSLALGAKSEPGDERGLGGAVADKIHPEGHGVGLPRGCGTVVGRSRKFDRLLGAGQFLHQHIEGLLVPGKAVARLQVPFTLRGLSQVVLDDSAFQRFPVVTLTVHCDFSISGMNDPGQGLRANRRHLWFLHLGRAGLPGREHHFLQGDEFEFSQRESFRDGVEIGGTSSIDRDEEGGGVIPGHLLDGVNGHLDFGLLGFVRFDTGKGIEEVPGGADDGAMLGREVQIGVLTVLHDSAQLLALVEPGIPVGFGHRRGAPTGTDVEVGELVGLDLASGKFAEVRG